MKKFRRLCIFLGLVSLGALACDAQADVARNFDGTNNLSIIASPTSVQAWRTVAFSKGDGSPKEPAELWQKAGQPTTVATNLVARLTRVLLEESSYLDLHGAVKYFVRQPCLVVTFYQGPKSVDVFFSFEDNGLRVWTSTEKARKPILIDSEIAPSRAALVRIFKRIFPEDLRVQALKEVK